MSNLETSVCGAEPQASNEIELNNAIYEMFGVLKHAHSLLSRITNPDEKSAESPDHSIRSLSEILAQGPQIIRGNNQEMHEVLNTIEQILFN